MAINSSAIREKLSASPHTFNDVVYALAERQGSVAWRIYATNNAGEHLFLDFEPTKAAAAVSARRYFLWLEDFIRGR